jgi:2-methylcitrate dehydratase PrpD
MRFTVPWSAVPVDGGGSDGFMCRKVVLVAQSYECLTSLYSNNRVRYPIRRSAQRTTVLTKNNENTREAALNSRATSDATVSSQLAGFIHATSFANLPPAVIEQAKSCVLDCLGTALAARDLPVPAIALKFVQANRGEASIFGHDQRVPAVDAALVNATLINGGTHDDFLYKSHPGAVTIPAAMAIAEEEGSSGAEFLVSIVLGYELVARAYLGGPSMLPAFRATGVAGAIGAAAAAAKLLKLQPTGIMNALGCATMFASGFGEGFMSGTMDVKLNVGWASRSGVSAALLARLGATAAPRAFEGESGFLKAFAGTSEHAAAMVRDLGQPFLIDDVVYKKRPVCIFVQTPMQLAHELAQENQFDPANIERVIIHAPQATFTNPGFRNVAPFATQLQARISASFCTAAALLGMPLESPDLYQRTNDPDVLAVAQKIELRNLPDETERVTVEVITNGTRFAKTGVEMDMMRPTLAKVIAKFRRLTADLPDDRSERLLEMVLNIEHVKHIRQLTDLLQFAKV